MAEDLDTRLARIEEKVTNLNSWVRDHVSDFKQYQLDSATIDRSLEARVASLELWRAKITGIAMAVGTVSGVLAGVITAIISRVLGGG